MGLFLSVHAVRRMESRGITRAEISEAIASCSIDYLSEEDSGRRVILGETAAGRRLKVVVDAYDTDVVITVADRDE